MCGQLRTFHEEKEMSDMTLHEAVKFDGQRLGRQPTPPHMLERNLKLADYLPVVLPEPPAGVIDVAQKITTWPMYLNDHLGDCACAAPGHMEMIFSKVTGGEKDPSDEDILALYELQGYVPGNAATDNGSSMGNVLSDWRNGKWMAQDGKTPVSSIYAYCQVDQTNFEHLRLALFLFDGLYIGAGLPLTAQGQSLWDVVPDSPTHNAPYSWGGHAINVVSIDPDKSLVDIITWGKRMSMTFNFWANYVDEVYAVVTKDLKEGSTLQDNGFNVEQLESDMAELGSA
jgi:hypothetical protein